MIKILAGFALLWLHVLPAATVSAQGSDLERLRQQVEATERAFAQTMADRDHGAFVSFLADDTIFVSSSGPLRGSPQVAAAWKPYFEAPQPPFSWEPEDVIVLETGMLAVSSGPVYDAAGKRSGTFNSIGRLNADGRWKIIFDRGSRYCAEPAISDGD